MGLRLADGVVVLVAFVAMEAVSYLAHRFVMHGPGMGWHRSHHAVRRTSESRWEKNDLFPVTFAAVTVLAMAAGTSFPSMRGAYVAGVGVTLYGAAYLFVHDVYIHGRLGRLPRIAMCEHLKDAHRIHHLFGGEPYGMLFPIVPTDLRARAATATLDPFAGSAPFRGGRGGGASGGEASGATQAQRRGSSARWGR